MGCAGCVSFDVNLSFWRRLVFPLAQLLELGKEPPSFRLLLLELALFLCLLLLPLELGNKILRLGGGRRGGGLLDGLVPLRGQPV